MDGRIRINISTFCAIVNLQKYVRYSSQKSGEMKLKSLSLNLNLAISAHSYAHEPKIADQHHIVQIVSQDHMLQQMGDHYVPIHWI